MKCRALSPEVIRVRPAEPGEEGWVLGEEIVTLPHALARGLGNAVSSPVGSRAKPRRPNDFVHFMPIRLHPLDHKISYNEYTIYYIKDKENAFRNH